MLHFNIQRHSSLCYNAIEKFLMPLLRIYQLMLTCMFYSSSFNSVIYKIGNTSVVVVQTTPFNIMSHALNVPFFFLNCLLFSLIYTASKHTINVKIPYTFFILKSLHNIWQQCGEKTPLKRTKAPADLGSGWSSCLHRLTGVGRKRNGKLQPQQEEEKM